MRFPRQAKIFRGQLDPAPVAAVVFLLVIFIQLGSLLYTQGVLVQLKNPLATIRVARDGQVLFGTNSYKDQDLSLLRAALQNSAAGPPFDLRVEPGAPLHRVDQVRDLVGIDLPTGPTNLMVGTDNPTVVVAVNFLGQYFYDNSIVEEHELTNQLKRRLKAAAANPRI